jgi:hypothetical protein
MTVTLSILTASTPAGAVEWARLFSYQLPSGHDPGLEAVLESMTEGRRLPGHTYVWADYRVPVELVPACLLDTEHEAEISHGRITGFHGVDLMSVVGDHEIARAVLREPETPGAADGALIPAA